ncbi:MAG: hypothetical protein UT12_C0002G0032 [Candidatus Curtissbacteria bacterium GW2011_GWC2_38_9]|uniref:Uncharacterized protein n=1 Tax=Candidatus Curtissbacteria bacterium GW2011_GWC2_38_9 TaxID=1618414 RepID=A0A0G0PLE9_9BACT|nr:MAG: hypothetical protein UT12_C0002G0032 [Candidatus Curtissbacteria bacterium GW2011_GWC2_38_9]
MNFFSLARSTHGKTPQILRTDPSSESSPKKIESDRSRAVNCSEAIKIPKAIGKSYAGPSLGKSAGARLTVIRFGGRSAPEFLRAARTLSFDSSTALSGRPTIVKEGKPIAAMSTSTVMGTASSPITAAEVTLASIFCTYLL